MPTLLEIQQSSLFLPRIESIGLGAVCKPQTGLELKRRKIAGEGKSTGEKSWLVFGGEDCVGARVFQAPPLLGLFIVIDGATIGNFGITTRAVRQLGYTLFDKPFGERLSLNLQRLTNETLISGTENLLQQYMNQIQGKWFNRYKRVKSRVNASISLGVLYSYLNEMYLTVASSGNSPFFLGWNDAEGKGFFKQLNELHVGQKPGQITSCLTSDQELVSQISTTTIYLNDVPTSAGEVSLFWMSDFCEAVIRYETFLNAKPPATVSQYLQEVFLSQNLNYINPHVLGADILDRLESYNNQPAALSGGSLDDGSVGSARILLPATSSV